ncbi:hypothetical protein [Bacillus sp. V5-8f]|uniref:hypothetical protein n=1 Tax=Bacillus sp. V5-8f TaxID=2053044 RepID=UPI0027E527B9|nr:hypothetical protein [Bacillus sp. V5-8f]
MKLMERQRTIQEVRYPRTLVGDVLLFDGDKITVSKEETKKLRKEIEDLMDDVWLD